MIGPTANADLQTAAAADSAADVRTTTSPITALMAGNVVGGPQGGSNVEPNGGTFVNRRTSRSRSFFIP